MEDEKNPVEETEKVEATEEAEAVEALKGYVKAEVSLGVEKAKSEIEAEINVWKAEQKALAEKKAGIYAEGVSEKRVKINSYLKSLAQAVVSGDTTSLKELTTGDAGENIVDRELSAEIRHLQTEYGVARREMFAVQLSKNSYDANALTTDVAVSWVDEGGVIPTVRVVLNQEELKLKKLAAIASMSNELLQDEEIDLFAFIATRVAEGFAKAEDQAFFAGEGSEDTTNGGFTGLLFNEDVGEVELTGTLASTLTVEKIYEMIDELPAGAQANAKFYGNRTIKSAIRLLQDGDGRYIYQDPINNASFATLAGKPWVDVEAMPRAEDVSTGEGFLILGDLKKSSILGYKGGIAVTRSNSAVVRNVANNADVNTFTTDREAIRWVSRVGAITILPEAVVVLKTASGS